MPTSLRSLLLATAGTAASLALPSAALAQAPGAVPTIAPATCVERTQTGPEGSGSSLRAHFWYTRSADAVALDIPRGPNNDLTPADTALLFRWTVPEHFEATGAYAFTAALGAEPITWTLRDPQTGEGGVAEATSGYSSRCVQAAFTTAPDADPEKPSGSTVRFAWTASVSGVDDFRAPDAPPVPWSAWREFQGESALEAKCTLDNHIVPCEEAEVVLTDVAPGTHRFRVLARPPLPSDIGPAAGEVENPTAFLLSATFTVAAPAPVTPVEPAPEPTPTPAPIAPAPAPAAPAPGPTAAPIQPQLPLVATPAPVATADPAACTRRKLTVVVPRRGGRRIRSASVTVDGKRVAVKKRRGRHVATIAARRLARDIAVVKITVRYKDGTRKRFTKRVKTCA